MPLSIEELRGHAAFHQLEQTWSAVCEEQQRTSFFVSHAWCRCCLAGMPDEVEPLVLLVRDGARVVGILPLLLRNERWRMFPARTVSVLENQDSPFVDLLLPADDGEAALAAVLDHLSHMAGWQVFAAPKIRRFSATHRLVSEGLRRGSWLERQAAVSPVLRLDGDWNGYWKATSQRFKKAVRHVANRVERLGAIEIANDAERAGSEACQETFQQVAARSWKADLRISVTRNEGIASFFEALTAVLHARRQLALWVLRLDGEPIATEYHVRDGDTVYALRSDFDERCREASPGAHLHASIIRSYFEQGVRTYDMGPGDSDYKQRWANTAHALDTFWLFKRTVYAQALYGLEQRAVPALRWARSRVRATSDKGQATSYKLQAASDKGQATGLKPRT